MTRVVWLDPADEYRLALEQERDELRTEAATS